MCIRDSNYTVTASFTMVDGCTQIAPISATLTISARPVTISPQEQTIIYGDTISQTEFTTSGLAEGHRAVSYTHLDVYKRQALTRC